MSDIYHDIEGFSRPLPNGLVSPAKGHHRTTMARLVWAAKTIGVTPFGPRLHRSPALELQWRTAMMRASVQPDRRRYWRSDSYAHLDPSEKGAVSFFLGQAQAKLFAHDFFRVSRFTHYDAYLANQGLPRRKIRPDFIGFYGKNVAIGVEAKGRSRGCDDSLVSKAKAQARSLPTIKGHRATATYAHIAYFWDDEWCAYLIDPPRPQQVQTVDPALLTFVYYIPIINAIRGRQYETVQILDVPYIRTYFEDVDTYISLRADIANLIPLDEGIASPQAGDLKSVHAPLYDLALSLDAESAYTDAPQRQDDESFFLGGDGVAVELGQSWQDWPTAS